MIDVWSEIRCARTVDTKWILSSKPTIETVLNKFSNIKVRGRPRTPLAFYLNYGLKAWRFWRCHLQRKRTCYARVLQGSFETVDNTFDVHLPLKRSVDSVMIHWTWSVIVLKGHHYWISRIYNIIYKII